MNIQPCTKAITAAAVLTLAFVFWPSTSNTPGSSEVYAGGVGVANDEVETLFTSSEDGKTIYMWQAYSSKPPKYLGKAEAILQQ